MTHYSDPWTWEYDDDKDDVHIYDDDGVELENSPISVDADGVEMPRKARAFLVDEMQDEFQANGFSYRVKDLMLVITTEEMLQEK